MMTVSLDTLAQLTASFCHVYEEEIQPWCSNRDAPPPTSLGPVCKRVDHLKGEIEKVRDATPPPSSLREGQGATGTPPLSPREG
jgi:hypothetical protein